MNRIKIDHDKIVLKQLEPKDVSDAYVKWLNDPEVNKFLEIRHKIPFLKDDVIEFVKMCNKMKRYHWGIMYNKKHVGNISCSSVDRIYNYVNISNLIGIKKYWNSDICKLSLNAAMHYLFFNSMFNSIGAGTYAIHLSGITLLTNLGFKKEGVQKERVIVNGKYISNLLFGITKKEWDICDHSLPLVKVDKPFWE